MRACLDASAASRHELNALREVPFLQMAWGAGTLELGSGWMPLPVHQSPVRLMLEMNLGAPLFVLAHGPGSWSRRGGG